MTKIDEALYYRDGLDRRQIKTKKAIIRAFFELTKDKDMSKITITELAKKADIDRKTFYLHFNSVAAIYNELGLKLVDILKESIINSGMADDYNAIYGLFMTINEILTGKLDVIKDIAKKNEFTEFVFCIKDVFCDELLKASGIQNTPDEAKYRLMIEFMASGTVSMYLSWLKGDVDISMDELAMLAGSTIVNGVAGLLNFSSGN
ncbi:MAG: TetR family transcriptional regulator [Clostridia bacterium]|nr:TetR family transcriptional regulator [Clostridia bacterium]